MQFTLQSNTHVTTDYGRMTSYPIYVKEKSTFNETNMTKGEKGYQYAYFLKQQLSEFIYIDEGISNLSFVSEHVDDACISAASDGIAFCLSSFLPSIVELSASTQEYIFTKEGTDLSKRIKQFFDAIKRHSRITIGELFSAVILIRRLIHQENIDKQKGKPTVISESNLGTLILCAVAIAMKTLRDLPFKNSWWSKLLGVPLIVINQSEVIFLKKISHDCWISENELLETMKRFIQGEGAFDDEKPESFEAIAKVDAI